MGGGGGSSDNTVRYAEYFESAHSALLNHDGADSPSLSVYGAMNSAWAGTNPFTNVVDFDVRGGFFSTGYTVASFPSLWDMFGKFMAGLDVHHLFLQTYNGVVTSGEIDAAVEAQAAYLDDDIKANVLSRFEAGMRDINAVNSTGFMAGRAIIEDGRIKAINKFASELRIRVLDISAQMWTAHLDWNKSVMSTYNQMFQLYFATEMDVNAQEADMRMRESTFDLSLFEYGRAMLGVVSGAQGTINPAEPSQAAKSISGALGGAAAGYQMSGGNPYGAVVGGVVGLAASFIK